MRSAFVQTIDRMMDERSDLAIVLADIGVSLFEELGTADRHPQRVVNVGIREQLQVGFAAGLAVEGLRPVVHTYAPFLVERPFEQLKLDFAHQGLGGVFVSVGASYDSTVSGRTHQAPEDVALVASLPDFEIVVPGHADEADQLLRRSVARRHSVYVRLSEESNNDSLNVSSEEMVLVRDGSLESPVVVAVGPMLDSVVGAVSDLDVTVLYATTVRPFDHNTLRRHASRDVILVEPYLAGTSAAEVAVALRDVPHRLWSLGVGLGELRNYGTIDEHNRAHGLDTEGIHTSIVDFIYAGSTRQTAPLRSIEAI